MGRFDRRYRLDTILRLPLAMLTVMLAAGVPTIASAQVEPPETPSDLSGPATDADGTYTISWSAVPGANTWYELQEKIGTGSWATVYSGTLRVLNFSKAVVTSYTYRVAACTALHGCSAWSSTIAVSVTGGITEPAVDEENPSYLDVGRMPY
ncbi:MAG TPA: hypothetical protein VFY03_00170, partial [Woeseiaceae bacterium]|nr:hypothetical protein [Woeseiaceae bacterium]